MDHNEDFSGTPRTMEGGSWYWISKEVILRFAVSIGPIGIAVYNVLASMTDKHQECFPSQKYIAARLGYSRATINKTLKALKEQGLIEVTKRNRYHLSYRLLEPRCQRQETEMSTTRNLHVIPENPNNNEMTRIYNHIGRCKKSLTSSVLPRIEESWPQTREDLLASDLAIGLKDSGNLLHFRQIAKKYPEALLRRLLSEARQIPDCRMRKNRTALFNYLLGQHLGKAGRSCDEPTS